jgi:hypothetical protein
VKASTLFRRYQEFAEQAGERWMAQKDFPAEIERRGFRYKRERTGTRIYEGLELANVRNDDA